MSGTTNSGRVPRLRFPEFRGAEDWKQESLARFALIAMGSSPRSEYYNENKHGLPLLQGNADIKNRLSMPRIFTSEITKECHIGDILLSVRAPVGHVAKSIHHACIGRGIAAIRAKEPNLQEFLYQWLLSYESLWASISQGGTFDAINRDDLWQLGLTIPSYAEQQKIADCLSYLDDLITLEAQKLDGLKAHKKGLMQQLFPREGETQPRLRFPEFQNAGEWSADILGGLSQIVRGGSPRPIDGFLTTAADGLNWLKIGDVDKEAKFVTRTAEKVRPEALSKTRVVHPGDLILSNSMSFGRPYILQIETCIHDGWIAVTHIANKTDRDFLYYSISAPSSQSFFIDNAAGSGVQNLNADIIRGLQVCFPTIPEQQRIASCLTSLDDLITAQTQKLEGLKTHKKGLMQQLFPQVSEE